MAGSTSGTLVAAIVLWTSTALTAETSVDALDRISVYEGAWQMDIEQFDSEFSEAAKSSKTITNKCWRSSKFYTCDQSVDGIDVALLVFSWDITKKQYATYPIPTDGGAASVGELIIDGDNWYYPWDQSKDGVTVHFRVVNHFIGNNTIEYRQEFSRDGKLWALCATGTEHRLSGAATAVH
jgi:hypothetical protein